MPSGDGIGPVGQGWTDGGGSRGDGVGTRRRRHGGSGRSHPRGHGRGGAGHGAAATESHNGWAPLPHTGSLITDVSEWTSLPTLTRKTAVVARPESCIACGTCVETCARRAITLDETAVIDASSCTVAACA